jgi:ectoine hydroxylase-related dioxygenase (phytanoyl-CoA dioxygenase family)
MSSAVASLITQEQKQQYKDEGYFILERVIPDEHLELLRGECQRFIDLENAYMDRMKTDVDGLNHRHKRYFVYDCWKKSDRLGEFIFSDLMADICRATIGPDAFLFWDQYVVKCAEQGMKFGWHQDSGYVGHPHRPYVTCWCALDDVSEANGTASILPFSRAGTRDLVPHIQEEGTNDLVGYHGSDPGIPVIAPAGSIAVFSSFTFHRSGANLSDHMRRVYLSQYSPVVVMNEEGTKPWGQATPFMKDSKRLR